MKFKLLTSLLTLIISSVVVASAPIINLNLDEQVLAGGVSTFDASLSEDINGNDLLFKWRIINAPVGSDATLKSNDDGTADFTPDRVGPYGFELIVENVNGESSRELFSTSASQTAGNITYGPIDYDISIVCKLTFKLFGCNSKTYNFVQSSPSVSYSLVFTTTDVDRIIADLNGEQITFYSNVSGNGSETFIKQVFLENNNELVIEASGGFNGNVEFFLQENTAINSLNNTPELSDQLLNIPDNTQVSTLTLNATDQDASDILFYEIVQLPFNGSASLSSSNLSYTSNADFIGEDEVLIRVYDTGMPSKQSLVSVRVLVTNNAPPILAIDNFSGHTEVMSNLLSIMDEDQVNVSISRQGMGGTITFDNVSNIVTYNPNQGFIGIDSFEILAIDDSNFNLETRLTVSVDVQPNTPPVFPDLAIATKPNSSIEFELSADPADPNQSIYQIQISQSPTNGTIEFVSGLIYRYTPNTGYEGIDAVSFEAFDSGSTANSSNNTVTINVDVSANIPPVVGTNGIIALKYNSGIPAKMYMRLADLPSDPDGVVRSIRWDFGDGNTRTVDKDYIGSSSVGTIYHYYEDAGSYQVTVTVFDDNGAATSVQQTVNITNSTQPSIRVIVDKYSGPSPLIINFNGSMTTDNGETPDNQLYYIWNFRDGSPFQEGLDLNTISHTYTNPGTYYPYVVVRDGENSQVRYFEIVVDGINNAPWPQAIMKKDISYGNFPLTVNFNGEDSIDSNGSSLGLTYEWNFSDHTSAEGSAEGKYVSHTFTRPGAYPIRLTVTDTNGVSNTFYDFVYVKNPTYNEFRFFIFDVNGKNVNLNIEEVFGITPISDIYYKIDWGDGNKQLTYNRFQGHEYASDGTYNITVEAELISGKKKTFTQQIVLSPQTKKPSFQLEVPQGEGQIPYTATFEIVNYDFSLQDSSVLWNFRSEGVFQGPADFNLTKTINHINQGLESSVTYVTNEYGLTNNYYYDINKYIGTKPTLKYKINSCAGQVPFTITFDATSSSDSDGLEAFQWFTYYNDQELFFRDLQFTYIFDTPQEMYTTAFLKDNSGDFFNGYQRYIAYEGSPPSSNQQPNVIPVYGFWDSSQPQRLFIDNYQSTDDGEIICYQIDSGDGQNFTEQGYSFHDYEAAGDYTVSITAVDNWGATSTNTFDITVPEVTTVSRDETDVSIYRNFSQNNDVQSLKPPLNRGFYSNTKIHEANEEYFNSKINK
jgi:PKD repeat protein